MLKQASFRISLLLILLLFWLPVISWGAQSFRHEIAAIYKSNPGNKNLYTRLLCIKQLSTDLNKKKLPEILQKNTKKLAKKSEAYHLYRIASISVLWKNGFIKEAYKLSETLQWEADLRKNKRLLNLLYHETADLYFSVSNDSSKAKDFHIKSIALNKQLKDTVGFQSACINTAQMCYQIQEFKKGDHYLQLAKSMEQFGYDQFHAYIILTESTSLMLQNKNREAQTFMLKNKELLLNISPACYYVNFGMIAFSLNDLQEAEFNLLNAEKLARKEKNTDFYLKSVKYLSKVYDKQHKLDLAYKYGKLRDSIQELTSGKSVKNTVDSLKLVNAQKTVELETRISEAHLQQSKQNMWFLLIALVLTGGVLLIVVVFLIRIRSKNIALVRAGMNAVLHFEEPDIRKEKQPVSEVFENEIPKTVNMELALEINDYLINKKNYLQKEISLQFLSKKLKSNQHDISEAINNYYGLTLPNLLNRLRIHEAMKLLSDDAFKHYSIEGISREVGYESISTFNRNFKEIAGVTPSFFQKEARKMTRVKTEPELVMERA